MNTAARSWLAGHGGGRLLDLVMASARFEVHNDAAWRTHAAAGRPVLFTLWHGRLLPLGFLHRGQGVVAIVSRSADGEYLTRVLEHWGFTAVRGSSSRGGDRALRELVRCVRAGRSIAITPDGPRGPREQLKPGVLQLAQLTGAPIVTVAAGADRAWWFVRWDRFLIPKPFARVRVAYGEAVFVPRGAGAGMLHDTAARVEASLRNLMDRVDAHA
jgi:lysophospholipid acyltransferase (LPLAT)-like uncharacterized protein